MAEPTVCWPCTPRGSVPSASFARAEQAAAAATRTKHLEVEVGVSGEEETWLPPGRLKVAELLEGEVDGQGGKEGTTWELQAKSPLEKPGRTQSKALGPSPPHQPRPDAAAGVRRGLLRREGAGLRAGPGHPPCHILCLPRDSGPRTSWEWRPKDHTAFCRGDPHGLHGGVSRLGSQVGRAGHFWSSERLCRY